MLRFSALRRSVLTLPRAVTLPRTITLSRAATLRVVAGAASASATAGAAIAFAISDEVSANPLLSDSYFPKYADIKAEHVAPAITARVAQAEDALEVLELQLTATLATGRTPAYVDVADASERIGELIGGPWGAVMHLKGVKDTVALRKAVDEVQPKVTAFNTRFSQSAALYKSWVALREDQAAWSALDEAQRRVVTLEIRGAELQGIGLAGAEKERFNEIQQELAKLKNVFSNNVLDGTKAFSHRLTSKAQVAGLPQSARGMLAATARRKGEQEATADEGPWVVTLDGPSLLAVLRHADDAALREKVYRAYVARASEHGDGGDNAPTIERILALRAEQARLLGFASYAALSLAKKMATMASARSLLDDLRMRSFDAAVAEHAELEAYAGRPLQHWDVGYYAEKLKKDKFSFDEEETRQYLQLDAVLGGLFGVCARLFGVKIAPIAPEAVGAQLWDESVRLFEVRRDESPIGYFYLDPFARPAEKRGGAWMNGAIGRSRAMATVGAPGGVRLPCAILVCNQSEPVTDTRSGEVTPSLMTFAQCTTLFHETGHGLQHMLTNVQEGMVSGISGVEWDAVEQPSQFMEYWVLEEATLSSMARHWRTGKCIPDELVQKVRAAKNFRAASNMLRQVQFATTDLALHDASYRPTDGGAMEVYRRTAETCAVRPPLESDAFLCAFQHIFAGGYAAGYFSYKWAEVLSADGFAAFEEGGLDNPRTVEGLGRLYADTVLGLGGSKPAAEVFEMFRGRAPRATALLRHNGLLPKGTPSAAIATKC